MSNILNSFRKRVKIEKYSSADVAWFRLKCFCEIRHSCIAIWDKVCCICGQKFIIEKEGDEYWAYKDE